VATRHTCIILTSPKQQVLTSSLSASPRSAANRASRLYSTNQLRIATVAPLISAPSLLAREHKSNAPCSRPTQSARSLRSHSRLAGRARGGKHLGKRSITADAPASPHPSTPRRRDSPSGAKQPKDTGSDRRTKDKCRNKRWRYSLLCPSLTATKSSSTTSSAALAGFHWNGPLKGHQTFYQR